MAHRMFMLAAALSMLAAQSVYASDCVQVTLMVNSTTHPWTYYWTPSPSTLATATCVQVLCGTDFADVYVQQLSNGLKQAVGMTKLTFDLAGARGITWHSSAMDDLFAVLSTLPIDDFTLWPSTREEWAADGMASFLKVVPKVTSLTLKVGNAAQSNDTVDAWVSALPTTMKSFSMVISQLSPAGADFFVKAFEGSRFSSLQHVDVDVSNSQFLVNGTELKIFDALKSGDYCECSLVCDVAGTDSGLVVDACAGKGNCNGTCINPQKGMNSYTIAIGVTVSILAVAVIAFYIYWRKKSRVARAREMQAALASNPWDQEMDQPIRRVD